MLPYLAQGANSAIEDRAVLGRLLGRVQTKEQLPKGLSIYERLRENRGDAIIRETFKQVGLCPSSSLGHRPSHPPLTRDSEMLSICRTGLSRKPVISFFLSQLGNN
ncbi:hypothetical protein BDV12DRAFT_161706 [Aspergillus spectabilis]